MRECLAWLKQICEGMKFEQYVRVKLGKSLRFTYTMHT